MVEQTRPGELLAAAGQLRTTIDSIDRIIVGQRQALADLRESWHGMASAAAAQQADADIARQVTLRSRLHILRVALQNSGRELSSARSAVLQVVAALRARGWNVTDGGVAIPPPFFPPVLRSLAPAFTALIQKLLALFTQIDTATASSISAASFGGVSQAPAAPLPAAPGNAPGEPGGSEYVIGPPTKPEFEWDEDFEYDSREPTFADYKAAAEWRAKTLGGELLRSDLDDALAMYRHYWDNTGTPIEFDYAEAYREDENVRQAVDTEVASVAAAADQIVQSGNTSFEITGDPRQVGGNVPGLPYPKTENWQKTIGGYQQWSHAKVHVEGNRVYMEITVEAEDHYNFNRGDADIATGTPDNDNGRFTEVGWAKPFDTHGEITKTISWEVGHPPPTAADVAASEPSRNPGREDRTDNRGSSGPLWPPQNNPQTGRAVPR